MPFDSVKTKRKAVRSLFDFQKSKDNGSLDGSQLETCYEFLHNVYGSW